MLPTSTRARDARIRIVVPLSPPLGGEDRKRTTLNRLDHRDPLVVDTRELGRRAGSLREIARTVPAPDSLSVGVVGVPEGESVDLWLRLEAVVEGVLVTGTARARVRGECVRCLEPVERELEADFQELFGYSDAERSRDGSDEDEELRLKGDLIALEPVLRDAVVLALPLQPVCREDCPGLCAECGARLADDLDHHHERVDPRWAALTGLVGDSATRDADRDDETGTGDAGAETNQEK